MAYDKNKNYQEEINKAVSNGDYYTASRLESERNEKIDAENLPYDKTNKYYVPGGVSANAYNQYNQSAPTGNSQTATERQSAKENYKNTANGQMISDSTRGNLYSEFLVPGEVAAADAYLSEQLAKIQSGKTSYSDDIQGIMDQIANREKFSYDVDTDPLFQQALASAMNSGKTAMQDTIGQASALTGGYGSSYATTAGNQAYNSFIEDAYDNLGEYYQLALQAYQMEGDEMYRQLDMYNMADDKEYNRTLTAYDATSQYRNRVYDESYQQFRDSKSDAFGLANLELNEYGQRVSDAYSLYNIYANEDETAYQREYTAWQDSVNQAWQMMNMQNTEWWNQKQFDNQNEWNQKQLDNQNYWNQKQMDFEAEWNQKKMDFEASENAKNRAASAVKVKAQNGYELTTSQFNAAKEAFESAKGGEEGFVAAIKTLEAMGITLDSTSADALYQALESNSKTNVATGTISQFRTTEGDNFNIKVNGNYYGIENKGKVDDEDTLKGLDKINAKNEEAFLYNGDAYVKYADGYYKVGAMMFGGQAYQDLLKALQK